MRSNPSPAHLAQLFLRPRLVRPLKDCTKEEEEKENKEMVGANSSQSRTRTRTYYPRKCKNTRLSIHECIPDDILFQILLLLPPQDIYYSSRLVCGKWYRIMRTKTFIHKHLEHASYGLLYRGESDALESLGSTDVVFISLRQDAGGGIFDTYKLNYLRRNTLWSSCNGLMLQVRKNSPHTVFFVTNPLTNQSFCLPPYPYPLLSHVKSGIGYDAASMTYKVVIPPYTDTTPQIGCGILTVGVDKSWRKIRTDHLSDHGKSTSFSYAVLTEGFVHWLGGIRLKSLNLETEIITETPLPIPGAVLLEEKTECHCMSTGRFLSLFLQRKKFVWEVFEMKPGTGEWRKLPNIYLEGQKGMLERLGFKPDNVVIKPCGWLKYPEVLALRVQSVFIIFYNLITCEISAEKLRTCSCFLPITLHKNSLSRVHQPRCTSLPMELVDPLSIKKDACWTISNITAGNRYKIQAVIEAGLIGPLVNLLNWISKKRLLVRRNQRENHLLGESELYQASVYAIF